MMRGGRGNHGGFSLIELVVVMAIVAILATVAVGSYSAYVTRGKRASAKSALLQDAQYLERNYTVAGCYTNLNAGCTGGAVAIPVTVAPQEGTQSYQVTMTTPAPGAGGAATPGSSYLLQAAPAGSFTDPTCGSFTLDNTGLKGLVVNGATITSPTDPAIATCWQH